MRLILLGLNHRAAPVEVRERLAIPPGRLAEALPPLREAGGVAELALLSTCNRLELYAVAPAPRGAADDQPVDAAQPCYPEQEQLLVSLAARRGVEAAEVRPYLYAKRGGEAARHLARVAAGLDSLLVGEYQILGQVKTAFGAAQSAGTAGPVLSALFRHAIHAGKRARTETEIGAGASSLGQVAASLAKQTLGDLTHRTALIIGAGKMSELAGQSLAEAGLRFLLISNRTFDKAQELAAALNGRAVHFDALAESLTQADLVIAATGAPHVVLHRDALAAALAARNGRPLVAVDLAVPRNIDPAARSLPGLRLYDMDDLTPVAATNHPVAAPALAAAEEIARHEAAAFMEWWRQRQAAPLITALRAHAEEVRAVEVARALRRLGPLDPAQERLVEALSQSLVNKLLHTPTTRLKTPGDGRSQDEYLDVAADLFGLP